jgi:hypothetical protein
LLLRSHVRERLLRHARQRDEITGALIGLFHLRQPFRRLVAQVLELLKFVVQDCGSRLDGVRRLALLGCCDDDGRDRRVHALDLLVKVGDSVDQGRR